MARVTVEDCVDKIPNRFELVLIATHRARELAKGSQITVDADNDKNPVIALREIAEKTISAADMREGLIHSIQELVEIDEPEAVAAPVVPRDRHLTVAPDQSLDAVADTLTEEQLLRAMQKLSPVEAAARTGNGGESSGS